MISSLTKKLRSAYTHENLHKITAKVIALYKNKQYDSLREIHKLVFVEDASNTDPASKLFYRLMMQFHPDRFNYFSLEIDKHTKTNDIEGLKKLLRLSDVLEYETSVKITKSSEIDETYVDPEIWNNSEFEYEEEIEDEEFSDEENYDEDEEFEIRRNNFFAVLKRNIYGTKNIELPFYYLEDFDTLDLAGYAIDDLDGLQYCKNLIALDLSDNKIDDVSELSTLSHLQEVYLSRNSIGYIDGLAFLTHLRVLDISLNNIDDISPLFELKELEYVNIVGNDIPLKQIQILKKKGIVVIH